jgi:hypothetical protein
MKTFRIRICTAILRPPWHHTLNTQETHLQQLLLAYRYTGLLKIGSPKIERNNMIRIHWKSDTRSDQLYDIIHWLPKKTNQTRMHKALHQCCGTFIFKVVHISWKQKARELIAMTSLLVKNQDNIPKTGYKLSCNLSVVTQSKYEESQTRRKSAYQHFCTSKIAKLNLVSKWINLQTAKNAFR